LQRLVFFLFSSVLLPVKVLLVVVPVEREENDPLEDFLPKASLVSIIPGKKYFCDKFDLTTTTFHESNA